MGVLQQEKVSMQLERKQKENIILLLILKENTLSVSQIRCLLSLKKLLVFKLMSVSKDLKKKSFFLFFLDVRMMMMKKLQFLLFLLYKVPFYNLLMVSMLFKVKKNI